MKKLFLSLLLVGSFAIASSVGSFGGSGGSGNVVGPNSSVDTSVPLYSGTSGKLLTTSSVLIDSFGDVSTTGYLSAGQLPSTLTNYLNGLVTGFFVGGDPNGSLTNYAYVGGSTVSFGSDTSLLGFTSADASHQFGFSSGPGTDSYLAVQDVLYGNFMGNSYERFNSAGGFDILRGNSLGLFGSTSGSVKVKANATTTTYNLTMPAAQGGASTFLQNDGSGNLSWAAGSGGGLPVNNPTSTGTLTTAAGSSGTPGLAVGATGTAFYNCDGAVHGGASKALCMNTGGTSGAGILAFGNAGGAGIPIIGSPLSSGLALISGINSAGGVGGIGAELRIFSRNTPGHGSTLFVSNIGDYYSPTFGFGLDDFDTLSPFKVGFLGPDGLLVGAPSTGTYPSVKPLQKLEVRESTASTAVYAQWDSAVTGTTASDGLLVGVDASGNAIVNNQENTDTIFSNNGSETARITSAGLLKQGNYVLSAKENNAGNSSTAQTINWSTGSSQLSTLTGNVTYTFSNGVAGGAYVLRIATGAGSFTATWPASVKWSGGTAPTITAAASKVDLINFYYDGTTYYGSFTQNY